MQIIKYIMELNSKGDKEPLSDYNYSNNISASDLDEETNIKLRGDAIGDTLYSQSFVLKTLLQFSDLKWSEEVEEDLCFLWDMTVEKDVCKYLLEISYPSLVCSALERYTENRFIEIIIGTLTNILCADCEQNITLDQVQIVLKELNTDDHLVLIQVVRFITALTHIFTELSFISDDILDKILFILYNSTNTDLLIKTLEALSKITSDFRLDNNLITIEVFESSLAAYKSVINECDEFCLDTQDKQLCCKYMLKITYNFCTYLDRYHNPALLELFRNRSNEFLSEVIKILNYFSLEENLLPVTDQFIFYMCVLTFILETLNINYLSDIFFPLTKILYTIYGIKDEVMELFESIVELECFLFARSTSEALCKDLKRLSKIKVKRILMIMNEYQHKFDIDVNLPCITDL